MKQKQLQINPYTLLANIGLEKESLRITERGQSVLFVVFLDMPDIIRIDFLPYFSCAHLLSSLFPQPCLIRRIHFCLHLPQRLHAHRLQFPSPGVAAEKCY